MPLICSPCQTCHRRQAAPGVMPGYWCTRFQARLPAQGLPECIGWEALEVPA